MCIRDRHEAVNACSNAASAYEQEHGDLNAVSSLFNGSIYADEKLFIYLDKSYHPCDKDDAAYKVDVYKRQSIDSVPMGR